MNPGDAYVSLWRDFTVFPAREEVAEKIQIYKPRILVNLDCQGRGPEGRMTVGGKVCYPCDQVVVWFASQAKMTELLPSTFSLTCIGSGRG